MKFATMLCLPALVFAGNYSGSITDLTGTGLAGVTVSSHGLTAITDPQGNWALGNTTGISAQAGLTNSVSRHLIAEHGHLGLAWQGANVQGRMAGVQTVGAVPTKQMAARSALAGDTIVVQWKDKRLVQLPMTDDSSGIILAIDTAWSDDHGIAWNPRSRFGSLAHAGQTYRTIAIGSQTWMAENLNDTGGGTAIGVCYKYSTDSCTKYGRLYTWAEVMNGASTSSTNPSGVQGICPTGWHVPSDSEWAKMQTFVDPTTAVDAKLLKSTSGWWVPNREASGNGTDVFGFRGLPGGCGSDAFYDASKYGFWWSTTESSISLYAWYRGMGYVDDNMLRYDITKKDRYSLRCVRDLL
jgi:uncharacterized protein (TIGR02145 family)